jgi:hypothetical protein
MATTKKIPIAEWQTYFDRYSRQFLTQGTPTSATLEIVSPTLGDQFDVTALRLYGLTYDPKDQNFEVLVEGVDHLVLKPAEIWVVEEPSGFVSTLEIVDNDGTREILYIRRSGTAERSETDARPQSS